MKMNMEKTIFPDLPFSCGTASDIYYVSDLISLNYCNRKLTNAIFPINLACYYFPLTLESKLNYENFMAHAIIDIQGICSLYNKHCNGLKGKKAIDEIDNDKYMVAQDVIDRAFLNIYIRANQIGDFPKKELDILWETLYNRWENFLKTKIEKALLSYRGQIGGGKKSLNSRAKTIAWELFNEILKRMQTKLFCMEKRKILAKKNLRIC